MNLSEIETQLAALDRKLFVDALDSEEMARAEVWQHFFPHISPEDFYHSFAQGLKGLAMEITPASESSLTIESYIEPQGPGKKQLLHSALILDARAQVLSVGSVDVAPESHGCGIARNFMNNLMEVVESGMDTNPLKISAEKVGGYTWARFGFAPYEDEWPGLQKQISKRFKSVRDQLEPEVAEKIGAAISNKQPEDVQSLFWMLAESNQVVMKGSDATSLGKVLLVGLEWNGQLDRNDARAMEKFHTYTKPVRHRHYEHENKVPANNSRSSSFGQTL